LLELPARIPIRHFRDLSQDFDGLVSRRIEFKLRCHDAGILYEAEGAGVLDASDRNDVGVNNIGRNGADVHVCVSRRRNGDVLELPNVSRAAELNCFNLIQTGESWRIKPLQRSSRLEVKAVPS
jgi:hypothetical protein